MSQLTPVLTLEQTALLFTQLKQLEAAGLPVDQVFALVAKSDHNLKKPLAIMQQQITKGMSIADAGKKAGLFNDTQRSVINAGETTGRLVDVYGQLADYYEGLAKRIKKVKSRLYFPALILVIALFVQPLPLLITGEISGFEYLFSRAGRLVCIGLAVFTLIKLPKLLINLGVAQSWHRLQLRFPIVASWIIKRQLNEFYFMLAIMLESGLSFQTVLPQAVATIKNSSLREKFNPALSLLSTGCSVSETLRTVPEIGSTMLQIIDSGEQGGKLAASILHFSKLEAESISLQDDTLAEWLPRLVYGVIALWMAYSILGSSISSRIPADL